MPDHHVNRSRTLRSSTIPDFAMSGSPSLLKATHSPQGIAGTPTPSVQMPPREVLGLCG
jgi:hypothetical protein